jgi:hypothetical protein
MSRRAITQLTTITCATVMLCLVADSASAGEITGTDRSLHPMKGRSDCAFSGLQDNWEEDIGFFRSERVQNWGQSTDTFKNLLISFGLDPHPGVACNPAKSGGGNP